MKTNMKLKSESSFPTEENQHAMKLKIESLGAVFRRDEKSEQNC